MATLAATLGIAAINFQTMQESLSSSHKPSVEILLDKSHATEFATLLTAYGFWKARDHKCSRKGFCRNPRGIFPNKVPSEFCGGFFGGFFLAFFLGKNRRKKSPKNPRQNSNRNLGVSRPESTLQESGLDKCRWSEMSLGSVTLCNSANCLLPRRMLVSYDFCSYHMVVCRTVSAGAGPPS